MTNTTTKPLCYLDSNILIYLKNEDSPFHQQAQQLTQSIVINTTPTISTLTLDETIFQLYLLMKQHNLSTQTILPKTLQEILSIPNIQIKNPPTNKDENLQIPQLMQKYSLRPRDAYHLLTAQHYQMQYFATFDNDFQQVFRSNIVKKFS